MRKVRLEVTPKHPEMGQRALNRDARAQRRFQGVVTFSKIKIHRQLVYRPLEPASRPGTRELAARLLRCSPEARNR